MIHAINPRGWPSNKANNQIVFMLFNKNTPHIHVPLKHYRILIYNEDNIIIVEVNSIKKIKSELSIRQYYYLNSMLLIFTVIIDKTRPALRILQNPL